eukprot:4965018-Alexandrium_andersonii.AAC.1
MATFPVAPPAAPASARVVVWSTSPPNRGNAFSPRTGRRGPLALRPELPDAGATPGNCRFTVSSSDWGPS